jgi:UDPglucose 6-dehydrogenase
MSIMDSGTRHRIAVIGSGYVGTVVATCLASVGNAVVAVEADVDRLRTLSGGQLPFFEPELGELLADMVRLGSIRFTADIVDALDNSDVVFLCVGTPTRADGHADMSAIQAAAASIGANLRSPHVLVTKSTVPIGSGHWLSSIIEDAYKGDEPFENLLSLVSCPEFLREGSAVGDFMHPDRIVIGTDSPAAARTVEDVYRPIAVQEFEGGRNDKLPAVVHTGLVTAEAVKYAANAFLATKISFINEIATICEFVGADVVEVATAIGLDPRIGAQFLQAGVGWGGSCFAKDLSELIVTSEDHGHVPDLLKAVVSVNESQRRVVIEKLRRHLKTLQGRRICLLGLAFKPNTDDLRDAPSVDIARALIRAGATVVAHDPLVPALAGVEGVTVIPDPIEAATRADAVVLLTEWPEYAELDGARLREVMRGTLIIDGRNVLDSEGMRSQGLQCEGIGRS